MQPIPRKVNSLLEMIWEKQTHDTCAARKRICGSGLKIKRWTVKDSY